MNGLKFGIWLGSLNRFAETFEEGTWLPVASYIKEVSGPSDLKTQAQQIKWIETVCGQKIRWMKGQAGIVVLDHDDGRKRIRIGQETATVKRQDVGVQSLKFQV